MECTGCPLRDACKAPCKAVEKILPQMWHGDLPQVRRADSRSYLRRMMTERVAVRAMLEHREVLKGRVREIFDLTINDALSQEEIALRMGLARRVVSTYLKRAYAMIAKAMRGYKPRQREPRGSRVR